MTDPLESVLRRDRLILVTGLAILTGLSWWYLVTDDACCAAPSPNAWNTHDLTVLFVMWTVMMIAMMIPTVAPMVLTFALVNRQRRQREQPFVSTGIFLLGYLIVWTLFSALAAAAQAALHNAALLSPAMVSTSPILGGLLLIAAGLFQWTPWKHACLNHCRTPLSFFSTDWREGNTGALWMGLKHGSFCLVCCWFLMTLLFVTGVMNLLWVAIITGFVLLEKVAPLAKWTSRIAGVLLTGWGLWMMFATR